MAFQLISDVHLEHRSDAFPGIRSFLTPAADNLLIAGDLGCLGSQNYMRFISEASYEFKQVVVILGNHEFYNQDFDGIQQYFASLKSMFANVSFLNNECVDIDGVRVIASTLWSRVDDMHVPRIESGMNDYHVVYRNGRNLRVSDTNKAFQNNVIFLYDSIVRAMADKVPILVMTHHLPCTEVVGPQFIDSDLNPAFVSNLSHIIKCGAVSTWVHGHSHCFMDKTIEGCRVVRNPLGHTRGPARTVVVHAEKRV